MEKLKNRLYFDISGEHLKAIQLLISNGCNGSAFALIRPFYETFFRALWINAYATSNELEKIRNDKFNFNNMSTKIDELDKHYTGTNLFKDFKKSAWSILCDFTHSGSKQLSRRWKDSKLESNYTENEILEIIIEITKTHLWFTDILFKIHGYEKESNQIFDIYCSYKEDTDLILEKIYKN